MNAVTAGVVLAVLVVGYPLYELVTNGELDTSSALMRGALVAGACAAGVAAVVRLALGYEHNEEQKRAHRLNTLFDDMEGAVADGALKEGEEAGGEAAPSPGDAHP